MQASSQDQQVQLTAQFTGQRASGTLRLASGRVYSFGIPQVPATAQVGVFEGTALIAGAGCCCWASTSGERPPIFPPAPFEEGL